MLVNNKEFNVTLLSSEFDELIKSKMWKDEDGKSRCSECDYGSQVPTNVKNHIEIHHLGGVIPDYSCEHCHKMFKSKNSFQTHKSRYKNGKCIRNFSNSIF